MFLGILFLSASIFVISGQIGLLPTRNLGEIPNTFAMIISWALFLFGLFIGTLGIISSIYAFFAFSDLKIYNDGISFPDRGLMKAFRREENFVPFSMIKDVMVVKIMKTTYIKVELKDGKTELIEERKLINPKKVFKFIKEGIDMQIER